MDFQASFQTLTSLQFIDLPLLHFKRNLLHCIHLIATTYLYLQNMKITNAIVLRLLCVSVYTRYAYAHIISIGVILNAGNNKSELLLELVTSAKVSSYYFARF